LKMRDRRNRLQLIFFLALFIMGACVDPYPAPGSLGNTNYLVVDGYLNASKDSVSVKINYSVPLAEGKSSPPEEGANVTITTQGGETISLSEVDNGVYAASNLTLNATAGYQLHIVTTKGASYSSDQITLRPAPVLDSVSWKAELGTQEPGIRFYVSGHDPLGQTYFYRYLYTEEWEYRAAYTSDFKKDGYQPVIRMPNEQVYTCWKPSSSTEILTASTKKLTSDIVSMLPLTFINYGSIKVSRMYSINVMQMAVSEAEYEYWELIKKTTENLGGLFDPLPSQVIGNVHNDNDPREQVLGWFGGGFVAEKRIFVSVNDIPGQLRHVDTDIICETKFFKLAELSQVGDLIWVSSVGIPPTGYTAASPACADCTFLGGENKKPSYWPQ
jgi:hypothetical protein